MNTLAPATPRPVGSALKTCRSSTPGWSSAPVPKLQLEALHELLQRGSLSEAGRSVRVLFLRSEGVRDQVRSQLPGAAGEELHSAPVLMLLAEHRRVQAAPPAIARLEDDAFRRARPGARFELKRELYCLMAARSVGLESGAMYALDDPRLDAILFSNGDAQVTALCGLGRDRTDPRRFSPGLTSRSRCEIL